MSVEDDRFALFFELQANREQLWVVKMVNVRIQFQCFLKHPARCGPDAIHAAFGRSDIVDGNTVFFLIALAISYYQGDGIAVVGEGAAFLQDDAGICA